MANKPARIYRVQKGHSYSRGEYIKSMPLSKITIFDMGDLKNADKFDSELNIYSKARCQITHNALEASRIATNKYLLDKLGKDGYYLKFRVYPHEVLRENKQAMGAGADRVSQGMRLSYGKSVGRAARVNEDQKIMTARVPSQQMEIAREALKRGAAKLPIPCKIR